jgi:hypothetical protein
MTTGDPNEDVTRDRLAVVLAAYGADPSRWPEADRKLASWLPAGDPAVSAALEEARATDAALARASRPAPPAGAVERLIARAAGVAGEVVPFARHARERPQPMRAAMPGGLAALSALAASLALGLYLGASGHGDWLIPPLLVEDSSEYLTAEFDVLDTTLQLFEDDIEL